MIVQTSMIRNDLLLLKKILPIWKEYADGFVFYVDTSERELIEYLNENKKLYNILEIIDNIRDTEKLVFETDARQFLFDTGLKYSDKIICLDGDEYLNGKMTKSELETLLQTNKDTVFNLRWRQYTSVNTLRVDGPWLNNFKDRIGSYSKRYEFKKTQMHSTHLPSTDRYFTINDSDLHIVHLQWMDKKFVAIKQYFWKITDYITKNINNTNTIGYDAYDSSVNNFDWEEQYTNSICKIPSWVFEEMATKNNYRLDFIQEMTKKYSIPNLGDWGYDIINIKNDEETIINKFKVSVITAIGSIERYGRFIPRYINNVKQQHLFNETEHIIVYSEWSDLFNELSELDNFKFIKEHEKLGVYNAWNIGIKESTTKYITNWNIDDIRHPLNTKIKYDLLENNDYDMAYSYYAATRDESLDFYNIDLNTIHVLEYPDEYEKYVLNACYAGPDPMWKKELHEKVGYFDYERFNTIGDWEMWIRFALNGSKFKLIPEVLCIYLDHEETISSTQLDKAQLEKQTLHKLYGSNPY